MTNYVSCLGIDKLMIKYKVKEITVYINKIVKEITGYSYKMSSTGITRWLTRFKYRKSLGIVNKKLGTTRNKEKNEGTILSERRKCYTQTKLKQVSLLIVRCFVQSRLAPPDDGQICSY